MKDLSSPLPSADAAYMGRGRKAIDIQQTPKAAKHMGHDHFYGNGWDMFSEKKRQGHGRRKDERREDYKRNKERDKSEKDGLCLKTWESFTCDACKDQSSEGSCAFVHE